MTTGIDDEKPLSAIVHLPAAGDDAVVTVNELFEPGAIVANELHPDAPLTEIELPNEPV